MEAEFLLLAGAGVALAGIVVWGVVAGRRTKTRHSAARAAAHTADAAAASASLSLLSPEARPLLERLRDGETRNEAAEALRALGKGAVPDLLAALESPAFATRADDPAAVRAAILVTLSRIGDPAAAPRLAALLRSAGCGDVSPLGALASLGAAEALPALRAALGAAASCGTGGCGGADPAADALQGVAVAGSLGRGTEEFRREIVPLLAEMVGRRPGRAGPTPSEALVALDPVAAARILLSDDVLSRGASSVTEGFTALADARAAVDPAAVMRVWEALPQRPPETSAEAATYGAVLRLLAACGHPKARSVIETARASGHDAAIRAARTAALALECVEEADRHVAERLRDAGPAAVTPPQAVLVVVRSFLAAHGHGEFFESPLGGRSDEVEAALRAIGATAAADDLAAARARFRGGVPADLEERRRRVGEALESGHAPFQDLDERLFGSVQAIDDLLADFVLAHAEHFRAPDAAKAPAGQRVEPVRGRS